MKVCAVVYSCCFYLLSVTVSSYQVAVSVVKVWWKMAIIRIRITMLCMLQMSRRL